MAGAAAVPGGSARRRSVPSLHRGTSSARSLWPGREEQWSGGTSRARSGLVAAPRRATGSYGAGRDRVRREQRQAED